MATNESSKYKLSVAEGTEYKLSVVNGTELKLSLNGVQGPEGPAGPQGPAGESVTNLAWSSITSTPTTLGGYGITDAVSSSIPTGVSGASQVSNIISITQAGYNAIASPLSGTLYIIVG
jgi:hypothetical protein